MGTIFSKIIAGEIPTRQGTVRGPVTGVSTQPTYLDLVLAMGDEVALPVAAAHRALLYVYAGEVAVAGRVVAAQQLAELGGGDTVRFSAVTDSRALLLAARPIGEPVVNWGPFVMNTREQIEQAIRDFRAGTLA